MQDTVVVVLKRSDAGIIEKALELFQQERGINKYELRYGINGLRIEFREIKKKSKPNALTISD